MTNLVGRLALAAAALATVGSFALAQGLPKNVSELEKQIGLSDAQRKKMEAVDKKYQPKFQAVSKKYEPQFVALKKKIEPLQKQAVQLQQKMNAEGKPIFDAMNKEKKRC